jgi:AraC-like DNA-binding protein
MGQEPGLIDAIDKADTEPAVLGHEAEAELAAAVRLLGPVADRLGSRAVIAQYEADIAAPERTRQGTSLAGTSGPLPRFFPIRDVLRISFNIHELVPAETVPARHAKSPRTPTDDNLTFTVPYAPSLRAALDLVARYGDAVVAWYTRSVTPIGDTLRITYNPTVPLGRIEPLATEVALATIHRIVETFVGARVSAARVHFAKASVSTPETLAGRFSCAIGYGGADNYMDIPLAWGALPSPYHDPALWLEGLARCEADMRALQEPPLPARVRAHVAAALDAGHVVTLAETARALGLSSRSLVRALTEARTTHHQIVEAERRARAEHLLAQPGLPLADVAERLGFTDLSSLGRKCRAWFGESPSRVRRHLAGLATA